MNHLTAPFVIYEAMCPFAIWLNSIGLVSDDVMAEMVGLMLYLMSKSEVIAERQAFWVEVVFIIKTVAKVLTGI